jgi:hypothetical protein
MQMAYNRLPSAEELQDLTRYVKDYAAAVTSDDATETELRAWTSVCRMLLSANEFVYLD